MFNPMLFSEKIKNVSLPHLTTTYSNKEVPITGIVNISSPPDGSCLFHSILRAFNKEYNEGDGDKRTFLARSTRNLLADALVQSSIDIPKTYYESMSRGNLASLGQSLNEYSLPNLQKLLRSSNSVGMEFIEALGHFLNLDIYVIDMNRSDLYYMGEDLSIYYKNRRSIIVAYTQSLDDGHYDTLGLNINDTIYTLFEPGNFLIKALNARHQYLCEHPHGKP